MSPLAAHPHSTLGYECFSPDSVVNISDVVCTVSGTVCVCSLVDQEDAVNCSLGDEMEILVQKQ